MSFQPRGLAGYPSASAIGFGTPITSGDLKRLSAGPIGLMARSSDAAASRFSHALLAGAHTSGRSLASPVQPCSKAASAPPELTCSIAPAVHGAEDAPAVRLQVAPKSRHVPDLSPEGAIP